MNFVDLLLVIFVAFHAYRGYQRGVLREGIDLVGLALALLVSVRLYSLFGTPLGWLGVSDGWANSIGGGLLFVAIMVASGFVSRRAQRKAGPAAMRTPFKVAGAGVSAVWSALFAAFLMILVTVVPSPGDTQAAIRGSLAGRTILAGQSPIYSVLQGVAKRDAREFLFYVRQYFSQLDPPSDDPSDSEEFFRLQATNDITVDPQAEIMILSLVNQERTSRGLKKLGLHSGVRLVARGHSSDMYRRGYFAHATPEGIDPFERMERGGVIFTFAGENLALAPSAALVHQGLMNSPKHKENILKPEFTDIGIGVYSGPYGLMVTQNFCAGCRA